MTCGAPLVTVNVLPSAAVTVASVRLWTGSKGSKWVMRVGLQGLGVGQPAQHGEVDRVVVVARGRPARR